MAATGKFEVNLKPQNDDRFPAGRMFIDKLYAGAMVGSGRGQMISKRIEDGASVYYAIEEFTGSVDGMKGAFTLVHKGHMTKDSQTLEVDVLEGSGSGALRNISGTMTITQDSNGHEYDLVYKLSD